MKINAANNNGSASIIIPKKAMKELNWEIGDNCRMKVEDNTLIIEKTEEKEYT